MHVHIVMSNIKGKDLDFECKTNIRYQRWSLV